MTFRDFRFCIKTTDTHQWVIKIHLLPSPPPLLPASPFAGAGWFLLCMQRLGWNRWFAPSHCCLSLEGVSLWFSAPARTVLASFGSLFLMPMVWKLPLAVCFSGMVFSHLYSASYWDFGEHSATPIPQGIEGINQHSLRVLARCGSRLSVTFGADPGGHFLHPFFVLVLRVKIPNIGCSFRLRPLLLDWWAPEAGFCFRFYPSFKPGLPVDTWISDFCQEVFSGWSSLPWGRGVLFILSLAS